LLLQAPFVPEVSVQERLGLYHCAVPNDFPLLIQGGMGAGVSSPDLAKAVAIEGHLGVVSGTGVDLSFCRRLQDGDLDGRQRRALEAFPFPEVAERILEKYYIPGGKAPDARYKSKPMPIINMKGMALDLMVVGNFVEVWLAKEGHDGVVGINYLEKIQTPHLPSLYGAMLAGVDYVLMGAGIPMAIPGVLDSLRNGEPVKYRIDVKGTDSGEVIYSHFDPVEYCNGNPLPPAPRPKFLAIVSTHILANAMERKATGYVDGYIIEYPTAGGHNAPPRGKMQLTPEGEPIYTERDIPDLEVFREIGKPFWLAGGYGEPGQVEAALELGATGVQVGTAFAYCDESGFTADIKERVLGLSVEGEAQIYTDAIASPTGFPFKVVELEDTLSDPVVYEKRTRVCDLGYLRTPYKKENGKVGYRCSSEPVKDYVRKGGTEEGTLGKKCLCNALLANIGLNQIKKSGEVEGILVTSGDDVKDIARFLEPGSDTYSAADVIRYLLPT
jgi:nitronate monooxygenase